MMTTRLTLLFMFFTAVACTTTSFHELFEGIATLSPGIQFAGEKYLDSANERGFVYYGIRYAAADRFQPSVANSDYSYLSDPSHPKQGYICPQIEDPPSDKLQNEDCLYLDVYVPPIAKTQNRPFPVMMYIHGGGFSTWHKDMYNSTILSAAINAIVVTVNYRLSVFGFLSTDDRVAIGNWALYDLNLALNWIEEHIAAFGGDTGKINIFGESAGAALTSALMLNDNVRGKIRSALAMSGSVFDGFAMTKDPRNHAVELANKLGCPTDTSEELISCLKLAPMDRILNASIPPLSPNLDSPILDYALVVDGHHIFPLKTYFMNTSLPKSGKTANFINWYLTEESAYDLFLSASKPDEVFGPKSTIDYGHINATISGSLADFVDSPQQLPSAVAKVMEFYNISQSDNRPSLIRKYVHFLTESEFAYGTLKESQAYVNRRFPLPNQFCLVSYDPGLKGIGAFHTMDTAFIFSGSEASNFWVKKGLILKTHIVKAFHNILRDIAYNGSTGGLPFGNSRLQNYLHLNQAGQWINEKKDFRPITRFFDSLRKT